MAAKNKVGSAEIKVVDTQRNEWNDEADFAIVIRASKFDNPNGDPSNANQPRQDLDGRGFMTDVCLKRKIRNQQVGRIVEGGGVVPEGMGVWCQSETYRYDNHPSMYSRTIEAMTAALVEPSKENLNAITKRANFNEVMVRNFWDVRMFGHTSAGKGGDGVDTVSQSRKGSVLIENAVSLNAITPITTGITRSANADGMQSFADGGRGSDTMGSKPGLGDNTVYVSHGHVNRRQAKMNKVSAEDIDSLKEHMRTMFYGDDSDSRKGMGVAAVVWVQRAATASPVDKVYSKWDVKQAIDASIGLDGSVDEVKLAELLAGAKVSVLSGI